MTHAQYWRAEYDPERDAYVVLEYGDNEGEPALEYRFLCIEDDEEEALLGGLEKWYLDEDGFRCGELHIFGEYDDEAAFEAAAVTLREEARQRAEGDNLDAFLAIIDVVKAWGIKSGCMDESVLDEEGLFELGPEDAYSLREMDDEVRLHNHVERPNDECWRLHVAPVQDETGNPLGWGVFALLYPNLTSAADAAAIAAATTAQVLDLSHCRSELDARMEAHYLTLYMREGDRLTDPELAFVDDSMILEWMSIGAHEADEVERDWATLEGKALRAFPDGTQPIIRTSAAWRPLKDRLEAFFAEYPTSPGMDDQFRAHMLLLMGLDEPFAPDSPWAQVELDTSDD
jgi:hypothetical protein